MAETQLILALAEAGVSEPVSSLQVQWQRQGIEVELLHFDNQASDDSLESEFRRALSERAIVIGGFSRGARIAARIAESSSACALLCLGYPFHKHGSPQDQHGLETLRGLTLDTLIVQGSRDSHGNREEVRGYSGLPGCVRLHWIEDGNHRFLARAKSGQDQSELVQSAAQVTIDFIQDSLLSTAHE